LIGKEGILKQLTNWYWKKSIKISSEELENETSKGYWKPKQLMPVL
jgi:hypothetical protein